MLNKYTKLNKIITSHYTKHLVGNRLLIQMVSVITVKYTLLDTMTYMPAFCTEEDL